MNIPKDPLILLSFINTKLRDFYPSLDVLCEDLEIKKDSLTETLAQVDYHYDPSANQFT
ncbi:MAG: DUF4250 domain-containing protein [Lachnospiraceae bacterium]|nr:DUF4250 domain-containing protein [Lachnospiraceae bacterium]